MEWKIGEIRQVNGEWYQCVEGNGCENCAFKGRKCYLEGDTDDPIGECCYDRRRDNKDVIFKKLEKVGEPYEYFIQGLGVIIVQEYILANADYIWDYSRNVVVMDCPNKRIAIEIKQTKEDMEQEIEYFVDENTNYSNSEKIGKNLKPFDLQKAKDGKPVCTRDGRKARIIYFDAKGDKPIIALIEMGVAETPNNYPIDGKAISTKETPCDLMMLPEKKERWVNVYRNKKGEYWSEQVLFSTKKEAIDFVHDHAQYVTTVKIEWEE